MRTSPQCQRTYPDDSDFCLKDGTPLPPSPGMTEAALASSLARRYWIVKKPGAGGMGSVFLAEQITLGNRPVALKVLSRKLLDDPDFLQRFHNEGTSTARIRHANVVTIYESGQADNGSPYIAMEYLEPETPLPAPSVSNPPINPPTPQPNPAQIVVQTSPNAQVYLHFRPRIPTSLAGSNDAGLPSPVVTAR